MQKRRPLTDIKRRVEAERIQRISFNDERKTTLMRMLEEKFNEPIELMLRRGTATEVSKRLGVTLSCVCRWRDKFDITMKRGRPKGVRSKFKRSKLIKHTPFPDQPTRR